MSMSILATPLFYLATTPNLTAIKLRKNSSFRQGSPEPRLHGWYGLLASPCDPCRGRLCNEARRDYKSRPAASLQSGFRRSLPEWRRFGFSWNILL